MLDTKSQSNDYDVGFSTYNWLVIPSCIQVDILKTFEVLKTSKVWPEICAILNAKANNMELPFQGLTPYLFPG
jgi:hypothetical protein